MASDLKDSDLPDFPKFSAFGNFKSGPPNQPKMTEPVGESMYQMDKNPRGKAVIINNKKFKTGQPQRKGTDIDRDALEKTFQDLLFEVTVYNDKTVYETMKIFKGLSKEDYSNENALVVCILTHGEEGIIYATDGKIMIKEMMDWFKGSNLAGKPKLFIFQACQGEDLMDGVEVTDAPEPPEENKRVSQIPVEADFLYAYSTVPGYMSWRNTENGSWFIQALVEIFGKHAKTTDLLTMMTRVNALVATYHSRTRNAHTHNKMQIPSILSMLRKDLYFFPENVMDKQVTVE